WKPKVRICRNVTSRRLAAPAEWAVRLIDPTILADHLRGTRGLKSDQAEGQANGAVDEIIMQRQQRAAEQGEMDEADRGTEDQHIGDDLPPWPPGLRDGASGKHRRAAAEDDGHEQEDTERAFLVN